METKDLAELLKAVPALLQSLFLLGVLAIAWKLREPIKRTLLPRIVGVKLFGFELELMKNSLDEAGRATSNVIMSEGDKWSAVKRAQRVRPVLEGARLLWVDDHPGGNTALVKLLRKFGVSVDLAINSEEGIKLLQRHQYDVVVSDIARDEGTDGVKMVDEMWRLRLYRWTIFYVMEIDERHRPGHAFGITNRPDHLLHLIMDALERERWTEV
jgi:hypothetical protein